MARPEEGPQNVSWFSTPQGRARGRTGLRLAGLAVLTVLLASGCDVKHVYDSAFNLGLPTPITDQARETHRIWLGTVATALAVGFFVWGLILYAVFRYRKNSDELPRQVRYNLPIEVLYTAVPFVIISVLFYYTAVSENYINKTAPKPDLVVDVVGFQWNWQFNYPAAKVQITGSPGHPATLVLPTDRRIRFLLTSPDVIHSFFVPNFLFKRDVVPGRVNSFEVTIRQDGTFIGRCAEYCGEKHSQMDFYVKAVPPAQFDQFIAQAKTNPAYVMGNTQAIPTGNEAPKSGSGK